MWVKRPVIELKGYRRLIEIERQIMRSPVGWTLVLIRMGGAVYGVWSLREGLTMFPPLNGLSHRLLPIAARCSS